MNSSRFRLAVFLGLAFFFSGCAITPQEVIQNSVTIVDSPNSDSGFFMGGFVLSYRQDLDRAVIEVTCDSEPEPISIELQRVKNYFGLEVFEVQPGACSITRFKKLYFDRQVRWSREIADGYAFDVILGAVTYLGHFDARMAGPVFIGAGALPVLVQAAMSDSGDAPQFGVLHSSKELSAVTSEFREEFPLFSDVEIRSAYPVSEPMMLQYK